MEPAPLRLAERLLALLSRPTNGTDLSGGVEEWNDANALDLLRREFPGFDAMIGDKGVLDFGCGNGWQALAMAQGGAGYVLGVDTNERCLRTARDLAARHSLPTGRLGFAHSIGPDMLGGFDVAISQNSFEHLADPASALRQLRHAVRPRGLVLITFGPPWLAPYGSHMYFFTNLPWVHLLFSERTVMRVRSRFRSDGAQRYEEVEGGLNRMTVGRFERLVRASGLQPKWKRYRCIRGLDALANIPAARELCINVVSCVLSNPS